MLQCPGSFIESFSSRRGDSTVMFRFLIGRCLLALSLLRGAPRHQRQFQRYCHRPGLRNTAPVKIKEKGEKPPRFLWTQAVPGDSNSFFERFWSHRSTIRSLYRVPDGRLKLVLAGGKFWLKFWESQGVSHDKRKAREFFCRPKVWSGSIIVGFCQFFFKNSRWVINLRCVSFGWIQGKMCLQPILKLRGNPVKKSHKKCKKKFDVMSEPRFPAVWKTWNVWEFMAIWKCHRIHRKSQRISEEAFSRCTVLLG